MRFFGIDIASETHVAFSISDAFSFSFSESYDGYQTLIKHLASPDDVLIGMEATGHYWQNLFLFLKDNGFKVCLLNPLQVKRFNESLLERTKTDAQDAKNIALFVSRQNPKPTELPEDWLIELKELVRFLDRATQEIGDKIRQLHRLVDLTFPELTKVISDLSSNTALRLLSTYPTAMSYRKNKIKTEDICSMKYDGIHKIKKETAEKILKFAKKSVGQHNGSVYEFEIKCLVDDILTLKNRVKTINKNIESKTQSDEICQLLLTIDHVGINTVARVMSETNGLVHFESIEKLGSYVGVIPGLRNSGKNNKDKARLSSYGNARLRQKLWMPMISLIHKNVWIKENYERLKSKGKAFKQCIIACMRKLLSVMLSVARNKKPFVPQLAQLQVV